MPRRRKKSSKILLLLVSVVAVSIAGSTLWMMTHAETPDAVTPSVSNDAPSDLTEAGKFSVAVTKPQRITNDGQRVSVAITINNLSQEIMQFSPGLQVSIIDNTGDAYPATAEYVPPHTMIGGPIGPAETRTENLDFNVPINRQPVRISFIPETGATARELGLHK